MPKLSKTHRELLDAAHQSADGHIEMPDGDASVVAGLIKRSLMISIPRADGPSQLLITQAGRAACGAPSSAEANQEDEPHAASAPETHSAQAAHRSESTPKGKIAVLLDLLRQPDGATVEAMMAAIRHWNSRRTGWWCCQANAKLSPL
jgi:hypothetical protein